MVVRNKKKRVAKVPKKSRRKDPALNVSEVQIKNLAFEYKTINEVDKSGKLPVPLESVFKKNKHLRAAWDHAKMINKLIYCASVSLSKTQTAMKLGFQEASELEALLESDIEAEDAWQHHRLLAVVSAKDALTIAAKDGNQAAIRAITQFLDDETPEGDNDDYYQVGRDRLAEMLGVSPKTITTWKQQEGLPVLPGNKFSIPVCVQWMVKRAKDQAKSKVQTISPLTQAKIEKVQLENAISRGDTLDRRSVIQRFTSIYQDILAEWTRLVRDLSPVLANKTEDQIAQVLSKERRNFVGRLKEVPNELMMSNEARKSYMLFFDILDGGMFIDEEARV